MSQPDLTVLLTVYNGMPYLPETVASVQKQTLREFIFLIINNGSTDGTEKYLHDLAQAGDERIRIEHLPQNIGRTGVLNKGLATIHTPFTAIIDADDLAQPTRLEAQLHFLRNNSEYALAGSSVAYIDREGKRIGRQSFPQQHEALRDRMPLFNQFAHAACTFRTQAVIAVGGYPEAFPYAQDEALWLALLQAGHKVTSLEAELASIRVHPAQASRDARLARTRAEDIYHLALKMLAIPGLSKPACQTALLRASCALWVLGKRQEALKQAFAAVRQGPLLLLYNPLLWERVWVLIRRACGPTRP